MHAPENAAIGMYSLPGFPISKSAKQSQPIQRPSDISKENEIGRTTRDRRSRERCEAHRKPDKSEARADERRRGKLCGARRDERQEGAFHANEYTTVSVARLELDAPDPQPYSTANAKIAAWLSTVSHMLSAIAPVRTPERQSMLNLLPLSAR